MRKRRTKTNKNPQKLRQKIKDKRNKEVPIAQKMKADPTSTMLAMGLDDANILKNAKNIVRNPHALMKTVLQTAKNEIAVQPAQIDDDDEAPPA